MMSRYYQLAKEYVAQTDVHEANAMAILIFYECLRKSVEAELLPEDVLTPEGLLQMFELGVSGKDTIPGVFEAAGIQLTPAI